MNEKKSDPGSMRAESSRECAQSIESVDALRRDRPVPSLDELESLYAQLGKAVYERTKDDEEAYLRHSSLYLAIARARKASLSDS